MYKKNIFITNFSHALQSISLINIMNSKIWPRRCKGSQNYTPNYLVCHCFFIYMVHINYVITAAANVERKWLDHGR